MSTLPLRYALDLTGTSLNNLVDSEPHTLVRKRYRAIALTHAPFFKKNVVIKDAATQTLLTESQYRCMNLVALPSAMAGVGSEVYAILVITDEAVSDKVTVSYQTVGGAYVHSYESTKEMLETLMVDGRPTSWPNVLERVDGFAPSLHLHALGDAVGWEFVASALHELRSALLMGDTIGQDALLQYLDSQVLGLQTTIAQTVGVQSPAAMHLVDTANPHSVSKAQLGLDLVRNYPVASEVEAIQGGLSNRYMTPSLISKTLEARANNNLFNVTKAQVGLGNVENLGIATPQEIGEPEPDLAKYVTNLALRDYIVSYFADYSAVFAAEVLVVKTAADAALAAANDVLGLSTQAQAQAAASLTASNAALTAATQAQTTALDLNAATGASEALAQALLDEYIASEANGEGAGALLAAAYAEGYAAGVAVNSGSGN